MRDTITYAIGKDVISQEVKTLNGAEFIVDVTAIKKIMVEKKINTISELAELSGINRNTLADVLNEKTKPSSDTMYKLVRCLEIHPALAGEIFFKNNLRIA